VGKLAVFLMAVLCFGMACGAYYLAIYQPTQTWQDTESVQGTVESTDVVRESGENGPQFVPVVTYRYSYEGETYTNDDYSLVGGPAGETPGQAREALEPYSAGESMTVHVVSSRPSESYLERGSTGAFMYGIVGFLALMGGLSVFALVADLLGVEAVDIR